jgi:hypothetical protein
VNYDLLLRIVDELTPLISGAIVKRAIQGKDRAVYLVFRKNRHNHTLLLSPARNLPRMHLVENKPISSSDVHSFVLLLRSSAVGSRLQSICLLNQDRIVRFHFLKDGAAYYLIFELIGSAVNRFFGLNSPQLAAAQFNVNQRGKSMLVGFILFTPDELSSRILIAGKNDDDKITPQLSWMSTSVSQPLLSAE